MLSWSSSSQNGQKETGVYLNRSVSVALVEGLIACDFAKKEVTILANTIDGKDVIIHNLKLQVEKGIFEVKKRDDLNDRNKLALELAEEINTDLSKVLAKERKRKKMNKWFYFGAGVVGGIVGYKQITK
jgi:S-adenosylmethionine:tRNA-ribosyltransferase-isomerase (queuine synthetase)